MSQVAIQRILALKYETGAQHEVVVSLFIPHQIEQGDWRCDYEIKGGAVTRSFYSVGIDSVQALTLALKSVRVDLDYIERTHKATFYFLEEPGHEFAS